MPFRPRQFLLTAFYRLEKAGRLRLAQARKYHKVIIREDTFRRIRNDDMFIAALQLSRIVNSLVSITRIYLKVPDNGVLTNSKDKLEVMMIYGSVVYEAMAEFGRLSKNLKVLNTWTSRHPDIDLLNKERGNEHSLLRTVLDAVRNGIMFHFERATIVETMAKSAIKGDVLFAYGATPENYDLVYGIVDSLILKHIVMKEGSGRPLEAVYQDYINYVGDMSTRITDIASDFIAEIIGGVSTISKSPLLGP